MIAVDDFRFVADWLFLGAAALTVFCLVRLPRAGAAARPRVLRAARSSPPLGMMLLAGGEDLIVIFLGLELMSVSVYVLAGINRRSARAAEAALKYFLLGAFASAFLLYGIALVYGATGTTNLTLIGAQVTLARPSRAQPAAADRARAAAHRLRVQGRGRAVPHVGAGRVRRRPDAGHGLHGDRGQGRRVRGAGPGADRGVLGDRRLAGRSSWGSPSLTMIVGNLVALAQRSLKRMLAYSSIAHAGYLLVAVASRAEPGLRRVAVLPGWPTPSPRWPRSPARRQRAWRRARRADRRSRGPRRRSRPWLAFALAVCMLSLLGFPGTAGFIGKWYILVAAVGGGEGMARRPARAGERRIARATTSR